jgi:hypothetical protein
MGDGRPRKITALGGTTFTEDVMKELKNSFRNGLNNSEACLDANISERSFYLVLEKNEKLKNYFRLLQKNVNKIAKQNIVNSIKAGDIDNSKWWSERKNKDEFSTRQENTGKDGESLKINIVNYGDGDTKQVQTEELPDTDIPSDR